MSVIRSISRFRWAGACVLTLLCPAVFAQDIRQFPTGHGPYHIALGPDGAMWFTQEAPELGRVDPNGFIDGFRLPTSAWDVALGSDGNLWLTLPSSIGRMTPSGFVIEFPVAVPPNIYSDWAIDFGAITSGPDGNLWFAKPFEARIGRITPSGVITEFVLPTVVSATGITAGHDGNVWFTQSSAGKIGRITPSGAVTEFDVPRAGSQPADIAAGADGNLWFTDPLASRVGRITPSGVITEFPVPHAPTAIAAGADGNLWAAGRGTLTRITPSGSTTAFSVPTATEEWLVTLDMAAAPDGSIWIADYNNSQIVRFSLNQTACLTDTTTLCLNNGRFRVTANWQTRDGSAGQGRGVALTPDSGYFWFFDAANVEVVVKVLNGCGLNSRYWTLAGGLTDVNVNLTVTDTQTGVIKTYTNPLGTPFQPIQDTNAFATCP